jgi:membrane protein DedA with SNARE-associated domain
MIDLIAKYGYLAVFVGAFFEGETVLVIAGFLASGGHLDVASVMLFGFLGGVAGDQFYFYIGRARGRPLIERRESWRPRTELIERILARHGTLLMLGYRFMYGLRLVTPLVLGAFGVARLRFLAFNLVNATVWSALIVGLGYLFGEVVAQMFVHVRHYEVAFVVMLAVAGLCIWLYRRRHERLRQQASIEAPPAPPQPRVEPDSDPPRTEVGEP